MATITMQIPGILLAKTLTLDSTSFMSGNLIDDVRPRFSLQTTVDGYGPSTTVNSYQDHQVESGSVASDEVGVVEWRSSTVGRQKTIVKAVKHGKTFTLGALMKSHSFGSKRYFGAFGGGKGVRWLETDGTWQCMTADEPRVLAVLHSRIATRGTRIEVSTDGASQMDTIVLTALLVLHGEADWKAFKNRVLSPYSFIQQRFVIPNVPHITSLTLTLSTNSFLNGLLAVGGQLMYGMRTVGNRTTISKYTWEARPRLEEFASIEWHSTAMFGKLRSILHYKGKKECIEDFMFSAFLGSRMRRFGMPDFLPWVQWIESPPSWNCVSHPNRTPLAILERRFMTAGTTLDVTLEGLRFLDAIVISTIFVVHAPTDWKRPDTMRRQTSGSPRSPRAPNPRRRSGINNTESSSASVVENGGSEILRRGSRSSQTSRISGISGDSEIPQYSPPPRGLVLDYNPDGYMDPRPSVAANPRNSGPRIDLNRLAQLIAGVATLEVSVTVPRLATTSQASSARIEEVPVSTAETPPPSYDLPGYSST